MVRCGFQENVHSRGKGLQANQKTSMTAEVALAEVVLSTRTCPLLLEYSVYSLHTRMCGYNLQTGLAVVYNRQCAVQVLEDC